MRPVAEGEKKPVLWREVLVVMDRNLLPEIGGHLYGQVPLHVTGRRRKEDKRQKDSSL